MKSFFKILTILLISIASTTAEAQTIIYVDGDATGTGDGQSWNTAYKYLQDALMNADSSDQVWVKAGTYYPDEGTGITGNDKQADFFIPSGVKVYGGFSGSETSLAERDWKQNISVLNGDIDQNDTYATDDPQLVESISGTNALHVVSLADASPGTELNGFFVTGGSASGGAVINQFGGGIYVKGSNHSCDPVLRNLWIQGNYATQRGGGLSTYQVTGNLGEFGIILENVTFKSNSSGNGGGGAYNYAITPQDNKIQYINCRFENNISDLWGAAVHTFAENSGTITTDYHNNVIVNNELLNNNGSAAAIYNFTSSGRVEGIINNCTIYGNLRPSSTLPNPSGIYFGRQFDAGDCIFTVSNSIFWENKWGDDISTLSGLTLPKLSNNIVQQLNSISYTDLGGNSDNDPLLKPDFSIDTLSPAFNAGDENYLIEDLLDSDQDGNFIEKYPYDFAGTQRRKGEIDIGAFEVEYDGYLFGDIAFYAHPGDQEILIQWKINEEIPNNGIRLYRNESLIFEDLSQDQDTLFIDSNLDNETQYFYKLAILDSANNEVELNYIESAIPNSSLGNVVQFDGSGDYVEVQHNNLLNSEKGTIEFWVKINEEPPSTAYSIASKHKAAGSSNGWNFEHSSSELRVNMKGNSANKIFSNVNLIDSRWHHIAYTYDISGDGQAILYIDGDSITSLSLPSINLAMEPIFLGSSQDNFWSDFKGQVDEFRIWNYIRSKNDIQKNMARRITGDEDGIVLALNFDEPTGTTTAYDNSKNNFDGKLEGDARFKLPLDPARNPGIFFQNTFDLETSDISQVAVKEFSSVNYTDVGYSLDGTRLYIFDRASNTLLEYGLSEKFNPSTIVDSLASLDVSNQSSFASNFEFSRDGLHVYCMDVGGQLFQYDLSGPFDLSTATYSNKNAVIIGSSESVTDFEISADGSKLFAVQTENEAVIQFELSSSFDISTVAASPFSTFSLDTIEDVPRVLEFSADGTRMFISGDEFQRLNQFNLTTPYDLSTVTATGLSYNILSLDQAIKRIHLSMNEQYLLTTGNSQKVKAFSLDPVGFKEQEEDDGSLVGGASIFLEGIKFRTGNEALVENVDYIIQGVPEGLTPVISIGPDSTYATFYLVGSASIHSEFFSSDGLSFTFEDQAFKSLPDFPIEGKFTPNSKIQIQLQGNNPPVFNSDSAVSVVENFSGVVIDINATTGDGGENDEGIFYVIENSGDGEFFELGAGEVFQTGELSFNIIPDRENPQDENGDNVYEITVIAEDEANSTRQNIRVTVTDKNEFSPFIAPDQYFSFNEDTQPTAEIGNVVAADQDQSTSFSEWTIVGGNEQGYFNLDDNGKITLNSVIDFETENQFALAVTVSDGEFTSDIEIVTLEVLDVNEAPVSDTVFTDLELQEGFQSTEIDLSGSFSDPEENELTFEAFSNDNSVVSVSVEGSKLLISEQGIGNTTIQIEANDGTLTSESISFLVTVVNVNDAPVVVSPIENLSVLERFERETVSLSGVFEDEENDPISFLVTSSDEQVVTASLGNDNIILIEQGIGASVITVTADDGNGGITEISFEITVLDNLPPQIDSPLANLTLDEGFENYELDINSTFSDPEGDSFSLTVTSSDSQIVTAILDGGIIFIEERNTGAAEISVTAENIDGAVTEVFTVFINPEDNSAPRINNPMSDLSLEKGFGKENIDLTGVFTDADGDDLSYVVESSDTEIITVTLDGLLLTITEIGLGTSTVSITVSDGKGGSATEEFTVSVAEEFNQAPVVVSPLSDLSLDQGFETKIIDLTGVFTDEDGDDLSYVVESSDTEIITVTLDGLLLTITEIGLGTSTVSITVSDGKGGSATEEFTVSVAEEFNQAPVVVSPLSDLSLDQGFETKIIDLTGVFADPENDPLSFSASSDDSAIADVSIIGKELNISENNPGSTTITVSVTDGSSESISDSFVLTIREAENNPPELLAPIEDKELLAGFEKDTIDISGIFSDPDSDMLSYSVTNSDNSVLTAEIGSNQLIITEVGTGSSLISLTAQDGKGGSSTDEFMIIVSRRKNNPPTSIKSIEDLTFSTGFSAYTVEVSSYFDDPDGDDLTFTTTSDNTECVVTEVSGSILTITEVGPGTSQISVTASDGKLDSDEMVFEVTVEEEILFLEKNTTQPIIYPNPAIHYFVIDDEIKSVSLYGQDGQLVRKYNDQNRYSLEGITSGIYQVIIRKDTNIYASKLVIR